MMRIYKISSLGILMQTIKVKDNQARDVII